MSTDLRKKAKNNLEKGFSTLIINAALKKTMENVRKHGKIELNTTERRRNLLVSEPSYYATKFFI